MICIQSKNHLCINQHYNLIHIILCFFSNIWEDHKISNHSKNLRYIKNKLIHKGCISYLKYFCRTYQDKQISIFQLINQKIINHCKKDSYYLLHHYMLCKKNHNFGKILVCCLYINSNYSLKHIIYLRINRIQVNHMLSNQNWMHHHKISKQNHKDYIHDLMYFYRSHQDMQQCIYQQPYLNIIVLNRLSNYYYFLLSKLCKRNHNYCTTNYWYFCINQYCMSYYMFQCLITKIKKALSKSSNQYQTLHHMLSINSYIINKDCYLFLYLFILKILFYLINLS